MLGASGRIKHVLSNASFRTQTEISDLFGGPTRSLNRTALSLGLMGETPNVQAIKVLANSKARISEAAALSFQRARDAVDAGHKNAEQISTILKEMHLRRRQLGLATYSGVTQYDSEFLERIERAERKNLVILQELLGTDFLKEDLSEVTLTDIVAKLHMGESFVDLTIVDVLAIREPDGGHVRSKSCYAACVYTGGANVVNVRLLGEVGEVKLANDKVLAGMTKSSIDDHGDPACLLYTSPSPRD